MSHTPLTPISKEDLGALVTTCAYSANTILQALSQPHKAKREVVERVTRARREQLNRPAVEHKRRMSR